MKEILLSIKLIFKPQKLKRLLLASHRFNGMTTHNNEIWDKSVLHFIELTLISLLIILVSTTPSLFKDGYPIGTDFLGIRISCIVSLIFWQIKNLIYTAYFLGNIQLKFEKGSFLK